MIRRITNEAIATVLSYVPESVLIHLSNAQKELLKAAEAAIDQQIKWIDVHTNNASAKRNFRRAAAAPKKEAEE